MNVNWSHRMQCNQCNAPKPGQNEAIETACVFTDTSFKQEPRDGRGGGYCEIEETPEERERRRREVKKKEVRSGLSRPATDGFVAA